MGDQPISDLFLDNINALPLWVKQVLYLKTGDKLKDELAQFIDVLLTEDILQYYAPKLTYSGKVEMETHERKLPEEYYTFYKNCKAGCDLFEIALANYWTFAQTCSIFVRSAELQMLDYPDNDTMFSVAQFIAGKIRTGEMLKKLGKINVMQLETALRAQKERYDRGESIKMAALMIELGFITDKDISILLSFKEDASKRFVLGIGFSLVKPKNEAEAQTLVKSLQKEIKRLDEENKILKNRLRKILNIK